MYAIAGAHVTRRPGLPHFATACDPLGLTARERAIVPHLLAGKTHLAIARDVGCHQGTVSRHVFNVYRKLNVHGRAGLVARFKDGLPPLPRPEPSPSRESIHRRLARLEHAAEALLDMPASKLAAAFAGRPLAGTYALQRLERTAEAVEQLKTAVKWTVEKVSA